MQAQSWNRYAYTTGNPLVYVDPDGRDIHYQNAKDQEFYEGAARRNYEVRQVLDSFKPGSRRDLNVNRGDPGTLSDGTELAAVTKTTFEAHPDTDKMVDAYNSAGGGKAGEDAANAVLDETYTVKEATITLGDKANDENRLHESGHIDQALRDPTTARRDSAEAMTMAKDRYEVSNSEKYAKAFAKRAAEKKPNPPPH
jgi:hypothetical protein